MFVARLTDTIDLFYFNSHALILWPFVILCIIIDVLISNFVHLSIWYVELELDVVEDVVVELFSSVAESTIWRWFLMVFLIWRWFHRNFLFFSIFFVLCLFCYCLSLSQYMGDAGLTLSSTVKVGSRLCFLRPFHLRIVFFAVSLWTCERRFHEAARLTPFVSFESSYFLLLGFAHEFCLVAAAMWQWQQLLLLF